MHTPGTSPALGTGDARHGSMRYPLQTGSPVRIIIKLLVKLIRVTTTTPPTPPAPAHAVRQRPALLRNRSRRLGRRGPAAVAKVLLLRRRLPAAAAPREAAAARRLPLRLLSSCMPRLCCTLIV